MMFPIPRGAWQKEIWDRLLRLGEIHSPLSSLRGRASQYYTKYRQSFDNMLERAQKEGFHIERIPGKHGGEHGAKYILVKIEQAIGDIVDYFH